MIACPYCSAQAEKVDGTTIYPHRPDLAHRVFWRCLPCKAHVGAGPRGEPLGRLANAELRAVRIKAHAAFDPLWKGKGAIMSRTSAYAWLAKATGINPKDCHMAMMDVEDLAKVIGAVKAMAGRREDNQRHAVGGAAS